MINLIFQLYTFKKYIVHANSVVFSWMIQSSELRGILEFDLPTNLYGHFNTNILLRKRKL